MIALAPSTEPVAPVHHVRTVPAACCICGENPGSCVAIGRDFEYDTSDDVWRVDRCDACGVLLLNPRPADGEFETVYPPHYHAFQFDELQFGFVHRVRRRLEARRLLGLFRDLPATARILDVGCGDGFHLGLLREFGPSTWTLEGIDASERAATRARSLGLSVQTGTVEASNLPTGHFDAVLMIMTVEHLSDPLAAVRCVAELLKPGGRLVIVTDNAASLDARLFGKRIWGGYHLPRHTYLFNRHSLALLAVKAGLLSTRIRTIVSPVNWVYSIRNYLTDRRYPAWLVNQFSLSKPVPLAGFTLLDNVLRLFGRGALLQGVFEKPPGGKNS